MCENSSQTKLKFSTESASEKYNPELLAEDNYKKAQWQIDDNIVIPQDDLYTIAREAEISGHLFDFPIIYTDPNAIDFDESYTQGPDTVIVPRSYFHYPSDGQNWETSPISDPSVVLSSNPKSNGQCQDIDIAKDPNNNENSEQISEPNKEIETAYESMQQPPSRQSDNRSTLEINDLITEIIPQNNPSHSKGGKYNLRANPNPNYSEIYR